MQELNREELSQHKVTFVKLLIQEILRRRHIYAMTDQERPVSRPRYLFAKARYTEIRLHHCTAKGEMIPQVVKPTKQTLSYEVERNSRKEGM